MKSIIIMSSVIFGTIWASPQTSSYQDAYITRYDFDNPGLGSYSFRVETSDGFKHEQTGKLKNIGTDHESLVMTGSYSYVGSDGQTYTVQYIADENGFQPLGPHLPFSVGARSFAAPSVQSLGEEFDKLAGGVGELRISDAAQASLIGGGLG